MTEIKIEPFFDAEAGKWSAAIYHRETFRDVLGQPRSFWEWENNLYPEFESEADARQHAEAISIEVQG